MLLRKASPGLVAAVLASLFTAATAVAQETDAQACAGRLLDSPAVLGGPLCLPAAPHRIVVLDPLFGLQMGVSLGLPIVGATRVDLSGELPQGVADLGLFQSPDIEALLSLAPDLVIGDAAMHGAFLPQLSMIAPAVLPDTPDWREYYRVIAAAAGREAVAEAALAAFDAELDALRRSLPQGRSVSFLRLMPGGFQTYVDGPSAYAPVRLLSEAGLSRPAFETVDDDTVMKRLTYEGLAALEGEVLLYTAGPGDTAALEAEVTAHPLWRALPQVRAGRVHRVEAAHWLGFGGVESARAVLADIRRVFAGER